MELRQGDLCLSKLVVFQQGLMDQDVLGLREETHAFNMQSEL